MFYANGTLTKYEVVDMDAPAAAGRVSLNVLPTRVPSITLSSAASNRERVVSSYFSRRPSKSDGDGDDNGDSSRKTTSPSPKHVSDLKPATVANSTRTGAKDVIEFSEDDDNEVEEEEEENEELTAPVRRRRTQTRAIVESDDEDDDRSEHETSRETAQESEAASSPVEDDVFSREYGGTPASSGADAKSKPRVSAARDWMDAFGRDRAKQRSNKKPKTSHASGGDGWYSRHDKGLEKGSSRLRAGSADDDGDSDEAEFARTHDEVGQLLHECEQIAAKLRASVTEWSGNSRSSSKSSSGSTSASASPEASDDDQQMSLATITNSSGRRVVTQDDIVGICETLELKPYQVVGVNWLLLLFENKVSGVLADEMGLGKTVQTIAFLLLLESLAKQKHKDPKATAGPHLVVVPASVLNNWKRELAWIAPTLRVVVYHGAKDDRLLLQDSLPASSFDVLLTTYTYFERDSCQDDRTFLRSFRFGYMILDEGHSIKNPNSSRFKRISAMRARTRLVLSGTPIQNNLNELLALLSFLMPRMFDHGSDELLSFFDGNEESKCAKVRKILAPFILRREKKYVLHQLVAKTVHVEMLQVAAKQRKEYTALLETVIKHKEAVAARKLAAKERKRKNNNKFARQVLNLLGEGYNPNAIHEELGSDSAIFTQLRKAANHPALLRTHYVSDEVLDTMSQHLHRAEAFGNQCSIAMVRKELESYGDFELHDLCVQYAGNEELRQLQLPTEVLLGSAKFDYLRELLPKLQAEGHRVLIFSQWTKLLDLLELLMGHMSYRYLRLDGSTDVQERQGLIDTYNADTGIFAFLLSTRAGGLGINLTAADTVILHDLDFNPTNDEQACDRCHRIGQTRPVTIYKLVSTDTVDHEIFKLGETKTQLNNAVLGKLNAHGGGASGSTGGPKKGRKDAVTVEMMLASVISSYKDQAAPEPQ